VTNEIKEANFNWASFSGRKIKKLKEAFSTRFFLVTLTKNLRKRPRNLPRFLNQQLFII
tara:strand:+ start:913 stop:1089 length:177 start_codon:yes stop_codon:yes gene_type:complete